MSYAETNPGTDEDGHAVGFSRAGTGVETPYCPAGDVPDVAGLLAGFDRVGLDHLGAAGLMRREDTKFLFTQQSLPALLRGLEGTYQLLEVAERVDHDYLTLYYDTEAFDLFLAHHRGLLDRVKVRERKYLSTDALYLEVKHRDKKGVTSKTRTPAATWDDVLEPAHTGVHHQLAEGAKSGLLPVLWNAYRRVTLVDLVRLERVTIDRGLSFARGGQAIGLGDVCIAEVKQARLDRRSPVMARCRELGVRPGGFSKYCMGVSLLVPTIKHNRFKPRLRRLERLTNGGAHVA